MYKQRAIKLSQQLINKLKQYNYNYKNFASDYTLPYRRYATSVQVGSNNNKILVELQSIYYSILALVKIDKAISIISTLDSRQLLLIAYVVPI